MTQFAHYDEVELLAYIEDELDADAARSLRERLASDPEVVRLIEAMRRDRAALRTEPDVEVPDDLADCIEQALTRPMLIAAWGEDEIDHAAPAPQVVTQPGEYRRRYNQPARRRRVYRMAMAASVGLMVFGATWLAVNTGWRTYNDWQAQRTMIAHAEPRDDRAVLPEISDFKTQTSDALSESVDAAARLGGASPETADSAVAAAPSRAHRELGSIEMDTSGRRARVAAAPAPAEPIAVDFALVIQSDDFAIAEKGVEQLVMSQTAPIALVQNFSLEEAMQLERQWLATRRQHARDADPLIAGLGRQQAREQRIRDMTGRALQQVRAIEQDFEPSRQLAGPRDLAASYARQLDYAGRGATHTITIRLSQLPQLLEELDRAQLPGVKQFLLEPLPKDDTPPGAMNWAQSRTAMQSTLADLDLFEGDPLIDLPIVIE